MRHLSATAPLAALFATLALAGCGKPADGDAGANAVAPASAPAGAPTDNAQGFGGPGGPGGGFAQEQTLDEMLERTMNRFARVDADGDGKLSKAEIEAARQAGPGPGGPGGGPGGRGGPPGAGGPPAGGPGAGPGGGRRFGGGGGGGFGGGGLARADANNDGVVTKDEVEAQTRERFKQLDTNGDGLVSRDELRAQFEARRAQGGGQGGQGGPPAQ